jgi:hypothetical protein
LFNMSEIVHSQIPDAEGNVIPSSIHEGSARISGQHGLPEHILLAMDASSYNVVKATCGFICLPCIAIADDGDIDAPPVNMGVGGTDTVKFMVQLQNGDQADYTNLTTWSTSDTSIASVRSAGVIKGVAVGDFTTYANGPDENTGAECCAYDGECTCPSEPLVGSGGGTVGQTIYLVGTDCTSNTVWSGMWGNPQNLNQCGLTDPGPAEPAGGACTTNGTGTTEQGTPKSCYQINTSTCSTTYCQGNTRVANQDCTQFLDQFPVVVTKVPAGCS